MQNNVYVLVLLISISYLIKASDEKSNAPASLKDLVSKQPLSVRRDVISNGTTQTIVYSYLDSNASFDCDSGKFSGFIDVDNTYKELDKDEAKKLYAQFMMQFTRNNVLSRHASRAR